MNMDKKEEFDLEFDFEKEFGFDPKELLGSDYDADTDEDFDFTSEFAQEETASPEEAEDAEENASVYQSIGDDEELDFLSDDFLASLGITLDSEDEEDDATAEEVPDFAPAEESHEEPEEDDDLDDEMDDDFEDDFADDFDEILDAEDADADMNIGFDLADEPDAEESVPAFIPISEPAFEVDSASDLGDEFAATFDEVKENESAAEDSAAESADPADPADKAEGLSAIPKRRRRMSKERMIKEVYLPPIIAGLAVILIFCFISSAIGRAVKNHQDNQNAQNASVESSASALQQEADQLLKEAEALANGYDYEAALAKLDTFSGDKTLFKSMVDAYAAYTQAKNQLQPIDDPSSIPNLSFHCLIADPSRAFTNEDWGVAFNTHYVTIDEFSKILQQLYDKGYVLVDFDSFIVETTSEDGKTTYSTQPIYLPEGKKPIMLTETLVNYETFSIDSDGDGEADAGGGGFASKLIVDANGNIINEMVDASGNVVTGAYDFVPILEDFIAQHPDFSYRGARAILAVSGEDGVFGYRTMASAKTDKGEEYYNEQVAGAQKIAQALRDAGYTIACYTYGNVSYGEYSATQIQADTDTWKKEVTPVLGEIDVLIYAKSSDISTAGNYSGSKYNVLKDAGFCYFISSSSVPWAEVFTDYVRQSRIMVTGSQMMNSPSTFTNYFDAASVLNNQRGS